ncbi:MAG: hypothetical protein OEY64_08595 [Nitrospinota bacterium]|nr:hypothetical protein [Nitrospinota bacterium]
MKKRARPTAAEISPEAKEIISRGIEDGKNAIQIQNSIRKSLNRTIPQKQITEYMQGKGEKVSRNLLFKNSGAQIVREFLEKIKVGEDVSHIQAVLEHAVYVDCLNRYSIEEDAFGDWDIKDVIKVTNDYKKMRLKSTTGEKLSGALAAKIIQLVRMELANDASLKKAYAKCEKSLIQKFEKLVAEEGLKDDLAELEQMQALYEQFQNNKAGVADV